MLLALAVSTAWAISDAAAEEPPAADSAQADAVDVEQIRDDEVEEFEGDEGADPFADIETITVTGQKGSAIASDTAESVTSFNAQELDAIGADNIADIAKITPNLEIRTAGATAANFFIRGVGLSDFSANSTSAVAVYQDDVALNAAAIQLVGLFDVQNVEVLRGPQGGGSGRNASAGLIRITSRKPTGQYDAFMTTSLGSYWSDDAINAFRQRYEGALEVPIVEGVLSTRISFRALAADPFQLNGCGGAPPYSQRPVYNGLPPVLGGNLSDVVICGEGSEIRTNQPSPIPPGLPTRVGDRGEWAMRAIFRFQPETEIEMDWLLNVNGSQLDQQSTLGQAIGTQSNFGERTSELYWEPDQKQEFDTWRFGLAGVSNEAAFNALPPATKLAATGGAWEIVGQNLAENRPLDIRPYRGDYDRVGQTTRDTWGGSLQGNIFFEHVPMLGPVDILSISAYEGYTRYVDVDQDFTSTVLFEGTSDDDAWQFSQEIKSTGESGGGTLRWELGGYYLMEELERSNRQELSIAAVGYDRTFSQDMWSFAFYGGLSWDFLEDFTLDAAIRYNWERKHFRFLEVNGPRRDFSDDTSTWDAPTGLLSLTYSFTDDFSTYWKYVHGWKPGHYNSNEANRPPARPETIDSLEVGFRGGWLDDRLQVNGSFFYYKYMDYQVFQFEDIPGRPPSLEILNADDAENYGAELDFYSEPLRDVVPDFWSDLRLTGRFGWLESQFLDFTDSVVRIQLPNTQIPVVLDYTGNRLPNSPRFKVSGTVEWLFDFGRFGSVLPRYDVQWTDDVYFDATNGLGSANKRGVTNKPDFAIGQAAYTLQNIRLAYRSPSGNFEISGWVRNITDQRYKTYAFDATYFARVVINFVADPRTGGVDLTFNF